MEYSSQFIKQIKSSLSVTCILSFWSYHVNVKILLRALSKGSQRFLKINEKQIQHFCSPGSEYLKCLVLDEEKYQRLTREYIEELHIEYNFCNLCELKTLATSIKKIKKLHFSPPQHKGELAKQSTNIMNGNSQKHGKGSILNQNMEVLECLMKKVVQLELSDDADYRKEILDFLASTYWKFGNIVGIDSRYYSNNRSLPHVLKNVKDLKILSLNIEDDQNYEKDILQILKDVKEGQMQKLELIRTDNERESWCKIFEPFKEKVQMLLNLKELSIQLNQNEFSAHMKVFQRLTLMKKFTLRKGIFNFNIIQFWPHLETLHISFLPLDFDQFNVELAKQLTEFHLLEPQEQYLWKTAAVKRFIGALVSKPVFGSLQLFSPLASILQLLFQSQCSFEKVTLADLEFSQFSRVHSFNFQMNIISLVMQFNLMDEFVKASKYKGVIHNYEGRINAFRLNLDKRNLERFDFNIFKSLRHLQVETDTICDNHIENQLAPLILNEQSLNSFILKTEAVEVQNPHWLLEYIPQEKFALRELSVEVPSFTQKEQESLIHGLSANRTLEILYISDQNPDGSWTATQTVEVLKMLQNRETLRYFKLGNLTVDLMDLYRVFNMKENLIQEILKFCTNLRGLGLAIGQNCYHLKKEKDTQLKVQDFIFHGLVENELPLMEWFYFN